MKMTRKFFYHCLPLLILFPLLLMVSCLDILKPIQNDSYGDFIYFSGDQRVFRYNFRKEKVEMLTEYRSASPIYLPDLNKIGFVIDTTGGGHSFGQMNIDGSGKKFLFRLPTNIILPVYNENHREIFFSTYNNGYRCLAKSSIDGKDWEILLQQEPFNYVNAAINKEGDKLLFASNESGVLDIFLMNLTDSSIAKIIGSEKDEDNPVWSNDESGFYYRTRDLSHSSTTISFYSILEQSSTEVLVTPSQLYICYYGVSPDETKIVLTVCDINSLYERYLYTYDIENQTFQQLTFNPRLLYRPLWYKFGKNIFFGSKKIYR